MNRNDFHLEEHAMDNRTCVIVCDKCGERGSPMSVEWNYSREEKGWEPQDRHYPKCGHVKHRTGLLT